MPKCRARSGNTDKKEENVVNYYTLCNHKILNDMQVSSQEWTCLSEASEFVGFKASVIL